MCCSTYGQEQISGQHLWTKFRKGHPHRDEDDSKKNHLLLQVSKAQLPGLGMKINQSVGVVPRRWISSGRRPRVAHVPRMALRKKARPRCDKSTALSQYAAEPGVGTDVDKSFYHLEISTRNYERFWGRNTLAGSVCSFGMFRTGVFTRCRLIYM